MRLVDGADHPPHLAPRLEKCRGVPLLSLWVFTTWYRVNKDITIWSWSGNRLFLHAQSHLLQSPSFLSWPVYRTCVPCPLKRLRVCGSQKKMHTKVWTERERNIYVLNPRHKRRVFRSWKYDGMWFEKVAKHAQQKRLYLLKRKRHLWSSQRFVLILYQILMYICILLRVWLCYGRTQ
jgi:hypothetical protein